ncbi:MAG TPA: DUF805 domain-containing protein [Allosphingosinicella sp.]|jgi:uncharacterized membrane protein YhaH (DUF805 family)|nr:DUF805 domain-containing protein [Allosphingosinicella sp.]
MDHMLMPLRRYADFSGRSRRREYWMFTLFIILVEIVLIAWIMAAAFGSEGEMTAMAAVPFVLLGIFALAVIIPALAVTVRRLHDQDKSGWHYFIALVPIVGAIVLLVFLCTEGTRGPNRYGEDPKAGERA